MSTAGAWWWFGGAVMATWTVTGAMYVRYPDHSGGLMPWWLALVWVAVVCWPFCYLVARAIRRHLRIRWEDKP